MRTVSTLEELKMPESHKTYLEHIIRYFKNFPKIEKVLLFGSCAKGEATHNSDIDLLILGADITDEDEWEIAWNCPMCEGGKHVSCDILSGTHDSYEKMSKVPGMIQCAVEQRGVDLSELLTTNLLKIK